MKEPKIEKLQKMQLVGKHITMSLSNNRTAELWGAFMPVRDSVLRRANGNYYSVEVYPKGYFEHFNPNTEFEKWAAVKVEEVTDLPEAMESLTVPEGLYAVFPFKGTPANVPQFMQQIFGVWLPHSKYQLDNRPHFALMGEKYKNNDPESEEDFWVPVRLK
jgi:AraC family transcriptional regulator